MELSNVGTAAKWIGFGVLAASVAAGGVAIFLSGHGQAVANATNSCAQGTLQTVGKWLGVATAAGAAVGTGLGATGKVVEWKFDPNRETV